MFKLAKPSISTWNDSSEAWSWIFQTLTSLFHFCVHFECLKVSFCRMTYANIKFQVIHEDFLLYKKIFFLLYQTKVKNWGIFILSFLLWFSIFAWTSFCLILTLPTHFLCLILSLILRHLRFLLLIIFCVCITWIRFSLFFWQTQKHLIETLNLEHSVRNISGRLTEKQNFYTKFCTFF